MFSYFIENVKIMEIINSTPKNDGYQMIAEYSDQKELFMIWPERPDNWRNGAKPVQKSFTKLAKIISKYEPVTMLVNESQYSNALSQIGSFTRVLEMSSDDAWAQDTLPIFVKNKAGKIRAINFKFNAYGGLIDGLYFPWKKDDQLAIKVSNLLRLDYYSVDSIVEGCSVITDGEGTIITTEDVLLAEDRNNGASKEFITAILEQYLGAKKIIWLKHGYFLDETGGDVDNMASFIRPGELALTWTDDIHSPIYSACKKAFDILSNETDAKGRHFKLHKFVVPYPQTLTTTESEGIDLINGLMPRTIGQMLTATYINYITLNNAIIFPQFNDPQDIISQKLFKKLFPNKSIIPFPVREILIGGGGLHTIIKAIPKF
jgi:agmatine deiminase